MAIALWSANQIHLELAVYAYRWSFISRIVLTTVHLLILTHVLRTGIRIVVAFVDVGE